MLTNNKIFMFVNKVIITGMNKTKISNSNLQIKVEDLTGIIPGEQLIIELLIGITEYPCKISRVTIIPNIIDISSESNASLSSKLFL